MSFLMRYGPGQEELLEARRDAMQARDRERAEKEGAGMSNQAEQIQREQAAEAAERAYHERAQERSAQEAAEQIQQDRLERAEKINRLLTEAMEAEREHRQSGHTCETCGKITTCDAAQHGETGGCSFWSASRDSVNHPAHYTAGGIECIEAIKAATEGLQGIQAVCAANAIKYVWRFSRKNGAEDIKKAIWYLRRLLKEIGEEVQE